VTIYSKYRRKLFFPGHIYARKYIEFYLNKENFSTLAQVRKLIFMNNDQTIIVPTQKNYSLATSLMLILRQIIPSR